MSSRRAPRSTQNKRVLSLPSKTVSPLPMIVTAPEMFFSSWNVIGSLHSSLTVPPPLSCTALSAASKLASTQSVTVSLAASVVRGNSSNAGDGRGVSPLDVMMSTSDNASPACLAVERIVLLLNYDAAFAPTGHVLMRD